MNVFFHCEVFYQKNGFGTTLLIFGLFTVQGMGLAFEFGQDNCYCY
jgi:hypothetical protein